MKNNDLVLSENDLYKIQDKKTREEVKTFLEKEREIYGSNDYWKNNKDEVRDSFIDNDFFRTNIVGLASIFSSEDFSVSEICIVLDLLANETHKNTFVLKKKKKKIMDIYNKGQNYAVRLIKKMKNHNIIKGHRGIYFVNPLFVSSFSITIDDLNQKIDEFKLL